MTEFLRVTPNCCEESTKYKIPYLEMPYQHIDYEKIKFLKFKKPKWCIKAIDSFKGRTDKYEFESHTEISFCPFCGNKVPEIEINPLSKRRKIYNTDSGDYCESCGERSSCCDCLPAPFRWRPIGVELKLPPKKIKIEDE